MPRAQDAKVRDIVGSAARDRLDVIDVQPDGCVAALAVGSNIGAPAAVAREHGVASAYGNRDAISGVTRARGGAFTSPMSFDGFVPANELFDQRDEHGLEGQLRKFVG